MLQGQGVKRFGGQPISVAFPEVMEARVAHTMPATHSQQDNAGKDATLENGLHIRVPLFIGPREVVGVEVNMLRDLERARAEHRRTA